MTHLIVSILLASSLAVQLQAEQAKVVALAEKDRQEWAGWLRGTQACEGGRVARHLAEILRARGLTAEFHQAGEKGGYTVAQLGPREAPVAAVLVAPVTSCPRAPDNADLQYGASARLLWRASALSASLSQLSAPQKKRIVALFLGGDDHKNCGRGFVNNTYPGLSQGAWVLDQGGLIFLGQRRTHLLVGTQRIGTTALWLQVIAEDPDPGQTLDRALSLVEQQHLTLYPGPLALQTAVRTADFFRPDLRKIAKRAAGGPYAKEEYALLAQESHLTHLVTTQCRLGPRLDSRTARLDCTAPAEVSPQDVAFALSQRIGNPAILYGYRGDAQRAQPIPAELERLLETSAKSRWGTTIVEPGLVKASQCGDTETLDGRTLAVPFFTQRHPENPQSESFEQGVGFMYQLLLSLGR